MSHTAVLITGDGIGPEVCRAVRAVFEAADAPVQFVFFTWPSEDAWVNLGPLDLGVRGVKA